MKVGSNPAVVKMSVKAVISAALSVVFVVSSSLGLHIQWEQHFATATFEVAQRDGAPRPRESTPETHIVFSSIHPRVMGTQSLRDAARYTEQNEVRVMGARTATHVSTHLNLLSMPKIQYNELRPPIEWETDLW